MLGAAWLTAGATMLLAVFAVVTAWYARKAFQAQGQEVATLQRQATDQAQMLEVQSAQLDAQRDQFHEQQKINEAQTGVLKLQAEELRESLAERKRVEEDQRRAQASKVATWFDGHDMEYGQVRPPTGGGWTSRRWGAFIRNDSDLPIHAVRIFFHYIEEEPGGDWKPILRDGPVERLRLIPPQHDEFVEIPREIAQMVNDIADDMYAVSIEFTDAAGNKWERDPRGALLPRS
jgi:hypothetical protein